MMFFKNNNKKMLKQLEKLEQEKKELEKKNAELNQYIETLNPYKTNFFPPGHFYSPIPDLNLIQAHEDRIFNDKRQLHGININKNRQIELIRTFGKYTSEMPFTDNKKNDLRYFYLNPAYSYGDATILHSMIRYAKPKRVVEVGSGYSSCMTLDTNELFFENSIKCSFIEPYPELLLSLLKTGDEERIKIYPDPIQDVDIEVFTQLEAGDILFIDSTHVSKVDSDVNHILFNILPLIKTGVYIHFHDIFYPFEYPKEWLYEERAWNENYILRAFLQDNPNYEIQFFSSYAVDFLTDELTINLPNLLKNSGGNIWLKKIGTNS